MQMKRLQLLIQRANVQKNNYLINAFAITFLFSQLVFFRNHKNERSKSSNWHAVHGFAFVGTHFNIF